MIFMSKHWLVWLSRRPWYVGLGIIVWAICVEPCEGRRSVFALLHLEKIHQPAVISTLNSANVVRDCFVLSNPM
jgi:hypothetical protein